MKITGLGTSLTDKLMQATIDIASLHQYAACVDISGFVNLVKAQTEKKINATQSTALLSASASLQYVLGCGPGI